ncbi:site-specific integrase [Arthrobacter sp. 24S4-2]|uniref:site-specific integrase n=1 Tax=Arthrobacter sp. 24S4-2 TaxID=2575374 RepID=UPI0010C7C4AF|nr:site-specific integrase [Arthrobacter sp. 24S4-2]QCO98585.1 site-specific integrase [Arthrobacter sp. 24S4-2]
MTGSEQLLAPPVVSGAATAPAVTQTGAQLMAAFPARGVDPSWPSTCDDRSAVLARVLAAPFSLENPNSQRIRRTGVLAVLGWLADFPGGNWQQRWQASGAEAARDWRDLFIGEAAGRGRNAPGEPAPHLSIGLMVLICADVIRPGLDWLLRFAPARRSLTTEMARTRDSKAFADLNQACTEAHVELQTSQQALTRIAVIMAAKGGPVAAVRVGDCVELLATVTGIGTSTRLQTNARSPLFYQLLRHHVWGEDAPAAIEMFSGNGQPTCEQLIDRYNIKCRPVRDVLVDYLRERQMAMDFSSLQRTAYLLGKLFWADLEAHQPGIDSLKFSSEVAASWKKRVMTRARTSTSASGEQIQRTSARLDGRSVFSAVRAFYLDLAEWADDDPARWGPWAVRCPVSATDVSHKKERLARKSRTDQRTRERLPVLPALVSWVQAERARTSDLLAAGERTTAGELFTAAGQTLRRTAMKTEATCRVWAEDPEGGPRRDLTFGEHRGFWTWAMVEVLRHTGIRIEELGELSHHSLIQYRLPDTGELVPLLQIAPSKTDAERILVISPELADVLSQIVSRIRAGQPHVSPVVSYDKNERVYNQPLPLLFQWRRRLDNRAVSETALRTYLDHALEELGIKDGAGSPMRYTFHDFRRIFITDAIMHGMPPHIAQLVAGHRDINTTMGYKAVYPEEVINGHREFIARRRALRPSQEYRTPTDEEWAEFIGHFEHRKVSIGDCGRSYDTPCIHEHSCLRCPLLRPDPTARTRLAQIRDNLIERIAEAESHRWLGEAEGLKVSLAGAQAKLAEMDQITERRNTTQLGMPTFTQAAGRTNISPPGPRNGQ